MRDPQAQADQKADLASSIGPLPVGQPNIMPKHVQWRRRGGRAAGFLGKTGILE
jgi:hypothetical protein